MKQDKKLKVLKSIGVVYENARDSNLESEFFSRVRSELESLSDYFHVSQEQSFLIALVFALNYKGQTVGINEITDFLGCNPMKFLEYSADIDSLYKKGVFLYEKSTYSLKMAITNDSFQINEKIAEAILCDKPCPKIIKKEKFKDIYEVLEKLYSLGDKRKSEDVTTLAVLVQAKRIISSNLNYPLIKRINDLQHNRIDTYIYIYIIWKTLIGCKSIDLYSVIDDILDEQSLKVKISQSMISGQHNLVKDKLIEIEESNFFIDAEVKLTDYSLKMLQEEGIKIYLKQANKENLIKSSKIQSRQLYFNENDSGKLDLLRSLLLDNNLKTIQERLSEKNMPIGVTALLHGGPGTGKTETVYQLARESGRDILKVDISQSKSAWFGESEKRIKAIFTDYKSLAKESEKTPILLFNEADAIISRRKEVYSSVSQTENAMQNILLEELENFEGLFLATTNLIKNLDSAFDRRFLFKIEFNNPDVSTKAKIWQSKMPILTQEECLSLASRYNFSGGQIDNVARKYEINEILHGASMNFGEIVDYCNAEILVRSNTTRIGYKKL